LNSSVSGVETLKEGKWGWKPRVHAAVWGGPVRLIGRSNRDWGGEGQESSEVGVGGGVGRVSRTGRAPTGKDGRREA